MMVAYLAVTGIFAVMVVFSGIGKLRRDPHQIKVVHEIVGVPVKYFPLLAACEIAGALGLAAGIWFVPLGIAAAIGLVLYFVGAAVSHVRVGDFKGLGPAFFMLVIAAAALLLRIMTLKAALPG